MWNDYTRLECSPFQSVPSADIEMLAGIYGDCVKWVAGGGKRANGKLQGLRWPELRDFANWFDQRCISTALHNVSTALSSSVLCVLAERHNGRLIIATFRRAAHGKCLTLAVRAASRSTMWSASCPSG